jgi:hypothetical protein
MEIIDSNDLRIGIHLKTYSVSPLFRRWIRGAEEKLL